MNKEETIAEIVSSPIVLHWRFLQLLIYLIVQLTNKMLLSYVVYHLLKYEYY